jgi:plastocyanin
MAMATLALAPDLPAQTGTIEGQVVLSPRITARRPRFRLYTEYGPGSAPGPQTITNEMANVVIYLDSAFGSPAEKPLTGAPQIRQVNESFRPHVLPVMVGSDVQFPNGDPFFHNVFSLSRSKTFDLGRYPEGSTREVHFDQVGVVQVFCHIHSDMSGIIFVTPNRFFATPGSDGSYAIRDIPAGTYRVVAWHERAKSIVSTVKVEPGKTAKLDLNIPIADVESARR